MGFKGFDYFTARPDTVNEIVCKVCGEICDVKRGVVGATSWASAIAKHYTPHDSFSCPHSDMDWHEQALRIVKDIYDCHSPSLKKIMESDVVKIIKKKKVMV